MTTAAKAFSARRTLGQLEAERDHLLASLADLDRELAAGDVDQADYEALRAHYVTRTAQTLRAIEALTSHAGATPATAAAGTEAPAKAPAPPATAWIALRRRLGRRSTRLGLAGAGLLCLVAVIVSVASGLAGTRQAGQTATGSISVPLAAQVHQQLAEASVLGTTGHVRDAVELYATVLVEAPGNAEALAYQGWLGRLAGRAGHVAATVRAADAEIARAVRVAPAYPAARAFDGIALLQDKGDLRGALGQFRAFLADRPPRALLVALGPSMARTFEDAHVVAPAALRRFEAR